MLRKIVFPLVLAVSMFIMAGCHHNKVQNPIANIDSKQPDKVLYDRAMEAMKKGKYTVARSLLDTLINTYPDSEYIARAKLSVGDSWYAEGGTAGLQQAEVEYKDFITFFPNLPEAAEAQLKVANIHYKQMEKPDRDYAQAIRAEEEYKSLIQQFPDSKLVSEAKQRLRDVQEVLAERQFRIAHFYFLRDNIAAAEARLESLVHSYPLYSNIDEALYTLGGVYEKQANVVRAQKNIMPAVKERVVADLEKKAVDAYSRIITRYPAMERAEDAKKRLAALNAPIPTPTAEALKESKAEEDSREETGKFHAVMGNFKKHPDMAKAAKVGEPNMDPEETISAPAIVQQLNAEITAAPAAGAQPTQKLGVETVQPGTGTPGPNQPIPGTQNQSQPQQDKAAPTPPDHVNDVQPPTDQANAQSQQQDANSQQNADNKQDSSSKKKGKKGIRKLIPF
jgi:outer membrane protein assembly factor BamD